MEWITSSTTCKTVWQTHSTIKSRWHSSESRYYEWLQVQERSLNRLLLHSHDSELHLIVIWVSQCRFRIFSWMWTGLFTIWMDQVHKLLHRDQSRTELRCKVAASVASEVATASRAPFDLIGNAALVHRIGIPRAFLSHSPQQQQHGMDMAGEWQGRLWNWQWGVVCCLAGA